MMNTYVSIFASVPALLWFQLCYGSIFWRIEEQKIFF